MSSHIEAVKFNGIDALLLKTPDGASAIVSLFGAQVLSWIPAGGQERIFLSDRAIYDGKTSIRGGIPVCFPQFSGLGKLPKHGFVRTAIWTVLEQQASGEHAMVCLRYQDNAETHKLWPYSFGAEVTVAIAGDRIDIELYVENTGNTAFSFTAALHSYLKVKEVELISLEGLRGTEYRDAADANKIKRDNGPTLHIDRETDRVYHDAQRPLLLRDGDQSLGIDKEGFADVVVWNPWEDLCAKLPDMEPSAFRRMLCIEAAAAREPAQLSPGQNWTGRQALVAI